MHPVRRSRVRTRPAGGWRRSRRSATAPSFPPKRGSDPSRRGRDPRHAPARPAAVPRRRAARRCDAYSLRRDGRSWRCCAGTGTSPPRSSTAARCRPRAIWRRAHPGMRVVAGYNSRIDRLAAQPVARGSADLRPRPRGNPVRDPGDVSTCSCSISSAARPGDRGDPRRLGRARRSGHRARAAQRHRARDRQPPRAGALGCDLLPRAQRGALRPHPLRPAGRSATALSPRSPNTCRHAWPGMAASRSSARRAARPSSICHCSPSDGSARR